MQYHLRMTQKSPTWIWAEIAIHDSALFAYGSCRQTAAPHEPISATAFFSAGAALYPGNVAACFRIANVNVADAACIQEPLH